LFIKTNYYLVIVADFELVLNIGESEIFEIKDVNFI